ncbi:unnamed protein product [Heterobilharzia americana]|nr:unnamed protein product [Heterobilharzia americana]
MEANGSLSSTLPLLSTSEAMNEFESVLSTMESISLNITQAVTTERYYNTVTSSVRDILSTLTTQSLHHDHITVHSEFACVGSELSEPDFQLYACSGSKITAWIASIFLISMSVFGIIKCLTTHGALNIFDLRRTGVSFPKRPEFFVLICSSLPLVFSVLSRPLFTPLSPMHKYFILGWGMAQTRFFFDLFTRTATIYHLVYWVYRTPIIRLIWYIYFMCDLQCTKIRDKAKTMVKPQKSVIKAVKTPAKRYGRQQTTGRGRTSEWGYADKRRRSKSSKGVRTTTESVTLPNSSSTNTLGGLVEQNNTSGQTVSSGAVNLIAPQPLFAGQNGALGLPNQLSPDMVPNLNGLMNPYGQMISQNMMVMGDGYNVYTGGSMGQQLQGQQPSPYTMGMGYGMGYGMSVNIGNYINQVNAYNQANFMYPMSNGMNPDTGKDTSTNCTTTDKPLLNDTSEKRHKSKQKSKRKFRHQTNNFFIVVNVFFQVVFTLSPF